MISPQKQRGATDCLRACVATILGIDYEDVPDLFSENGDEQEKLLIDFLSIFGVVPVTLSISGPLPPDLDFLHITNVESTSHAHAIVSRALKPFFDPARDELLTEYKVLSHTFFVYAGEPVDLFKFCSKSLWPD